jgi:tRNA (guanine-N7-)-methyltransferase
LTRAQARALAELSGRYCLAPEDRLLDVSRIFGRDALVGLEIGFGMGHALIDWALERPHWNLLGLEVYQPGIGSAMLALERDGIVNVRLLEGPAEVVLESRLGAASLDEVRIFFPDPWPKKRHHKRRLLQPEFVTLLASRLRPDARLWVATDWDEYQHWIVDVLDAEPALLRDPEPVTGQHQTGAAAGTQRPRSRFECRGLRLGHQVWDLRYRRKR